MSIKVLLADDEESILELMARKVADSGYDVLTAKDGQEALAKAQQDLPDIIVLDLTMPKLDGWQVLRELRLDPNPKKWQPVIIVSALSEVSNLKKGMDLQADHYLTKPCKMEDIIKAIRLMVSLIPMRQ